MSKYDYLKYGILFILHIIFLMILIYTYIIYVYNIIDLNIFSEILLFLIFILCVDVFVMFNESDNRYIYIRFYVVSNIICFILGVICFILFEINKNKRIKQNSFLITFNFITLFIYIIILIINYIYLFIKESYFEDSKCNNKMKFKEYNTNDNEDTIYDKSKEKFDKV